MNFPARKAKGFTLMEVVVTIVVIGILGVGIAGFIGRTTQGMIDASERSKISAIAWVVSEKVSREIREALPNSSHTLSGGSCLEFIPTVAATDYFGLGSAQSVPVLRSDDRFEVVPFPNLAAGFSFATFSYRIAVYPDALANLYGDVNTGSSNSVVSSLIDDIQDATTHPADAPVETNAVRVVLDADHQFPLDSPTKRLFVVEDPVMFCFSGDYLYRYYDYGFDSTVDTSKRTVMARGISAGSGTFEYTDAALTRNAVVNIAYSIEGSNGEEQKINQEVQIRNVP